MTIYVPDELASQIKQHSDLNVSAVCQGALRAELERRGERPAAAQRSDCIARALAKAHLAVERAVAEADQAGPRRSGPNPH